MAGVKKSRTIALDAALEVKLVALCENLGVTPHSYLLNEIGKCVSRDYLSFQVANNQQSSLDDFFGKMESVMQVLAKANEPQTVTVGTKRVPIGK